jgi:hypothetical protein
MMSRDNLSDFSSQIGYHPLATNDAEPYAITLYRLCDPLSRLKS